MSWPMAALLLLGVFAMIRLQAERSIAKRSRKRRRVAARSYRPHMTYALRRKAAGGGESDEIGELLARFNAAARATRELLDRIGRAEAGQAARGIAPSAASDALDAALRQADRTKPQQPDRK